MRTSIDLKQFYNKAHYSVLYVDQPEYTAYVLITEERAEKFLNDLSIRKVRILIDDDMAAKLNLLDMGQPVNVLELDLI